MKWTLLYSRSAVGTIYTIPKDIWQQARQLIWSLQENPLPENVQADQDDASKYWIALPGDYVLFYEILDEKHAVRIIEIK